MYLYCKFIVVCSVWLGLILNCVARAFSDISFLPNDVLGHDAGSDFSLSAETDEYFLTAQFPDDVATGDQSFDANLFDANTFDAEFDAKSFDANGFDAEFFDDSAVDANSLDDNLFADNLFLADTQSCVQPLGKLRARQASCPISSGSIRLDDEGYLPSDERVRTDEEVEE